MQITSASDVGALVRRYRQRAKLTQQQLADRLRITRQLLSRFEQGKSDLPLGIVLQAMRELDASIDVGTRAERAGVIGLAMPRLPQVEVPSTAWSTAVSTIPRLDGPARAAIQQAVAGLFTAREDTLRALRALPAASSQDGADG